MKKLSFKPFLWRIETQLNKKENKDRIKYLVKRLIHELESQGYPTGNPDSNDISIWLRTYKGIEGCDNIIEVCNIGRGKLDLKIEI